MRINICRSCAAIVAPSHCVWRGVLRPPAGRFETRHTPPANRRHAPIGILRCGLIERAL